MKQRGLAYQRLATEDVVAQPAAARAQRQQKGRKLSDYKVCA
jgi:hypothetical protein